MKLFQQPIRVIELVLHFKNWLVAVSDQNRTWGLKKNNSVQNMAQNIPPIFFETILTYGWKQWWIALVQMHGWRGWYFVKWYFWSVLSGRCSGSFLWGNENGGVWQKDSSGLSQQMAVFNGKSKSRNFRNFQKLFLYAYLISLKINLALLWYNFLTKIGLSDIAYYSITIP